MVTDGVVADGVPRPAAVQSGGEPRRLPVAPPGDGGETAVGPLPGTPDSPDSPGTPLAPLALDAPGLVAVALLRDGGDLLIDYGTPGTVVLKEFFDALVRGEAPALKAGAGAAVPAARIAEALTAGERELAGAIGDDGEAPVFRDVVAVPVGSRVGVIALLGPDGLCFAGGIPAAARPSPAGGLERSARGLVPQDGSPSPVTGGGDGETGLETGEVEAPAGRQASPLHHDVIEVDIPVAGEAVAVRLLVTYDRDEADAAPGIVDDRVDLAWFDGRDWAPVANGGSIAKQVGADAVRLRLRRVDDGGRTLPADPARFSFAVCEMDAHDAAAPPGHGAPADIPSGDAAAVSHSLEYRSPAPSADIISLAASAAPVLKAMPVAEAELTPEETELPDFVYGIEDMDPTAGGRLPDHELADPMADPMADARPDPGPGPAERPEREREDGRPPPDDGGAP